MKKSNEWSEAICGATNFPLNKAGLDLIVEQIQCDALLHAAHIVHDMSRGTKSEDRAIAIDEARGIIMDEVKHMALMRSVKSETSDHCELHYKYKPGCAGCCEARENAERTAEPSNARADLPPTPGVARDSGTEGVIGG